ncbi:DUF262 domain-containing protein [bacterium 1xD42-87]|nr:DUF262 domain-containing protein [bacterium 1xD42-87]
MKVSSGNKPVQTLANKVKRGNIILKHRLQRREGVWNKESKSLLIDSLLRGYIVNPIHTISEGGKQYVIDGVQRLGTISDFLNDGFSLYKNLNPVEIEDMTYEIAGLKFSKLEQPVKDAICDAQIQVYEITEYTDKDVREMFSRLNSGKPLNTTQKMTPNMSDYMSDAIFDIVSHPFFEKVLTPAQFKSSVDQATALEILMLCATTEDYEINSFSRKDKEKFIEYSNYKDLNDKVELIKQALNKLDENFDEDVKIPKTSLSFIIFAICRVIKEKKGMTKAMDAIKDFLANYDTNEEYKGYITQGTSANTSVVQRLEYWRHIVKSL